MTIKSETLGSLEFAIGADNLPELSLSNSSMMEMNNSYSLLFPQLGDSKAYGTHLISLNLTDDEGISSIYSFNVTFLESFVFQN